MMGRREILPAVIRFAGEMAEAENRIRACAPELAGETTEGLTGKLTRGYRELHDAMEALEKALREKPAEESTLQTARYMKDVVRPAMERMRDCADRLEMITERKAWPFPTYDELLFNI